MPARPLSKNTVRPLSLFPTAAVLALAALGTACGGGSRQVAIAPTAVVNPPDTSPPGSSANPSPAPAAPAAAAPAPAPAESAPAPPAPAPTTAAEAAPSPAPEAPPDSPLPTPPGDATVFDH